jgi:hypothetical protein
LRAAGLLDPADAALDALGTSEDEPEPTALENPGQSA